MTKFTGSVYKLFLKTPNNDWGIIVPTITLIGDFVSMTIFYEDLDIEKTWGAYDCINGDILMENTDTLYAHMMAHPTPNLIDMEIEIKEVV